MSFPCIHPIIRGDSGIRPNPLIQFFFPCMALPCRVYGKGKEMKDKDYRRTELQKSITYMIVSVVCATVSVMLAIITILLQYL